MNKGVHLFQRFGQLVIFLPLVFLYSIVVLFSNFRQSEFDLTLFDDAMISMTYARTLAESGQLIWYPNAERVQGFTNPLWTFIMAILHTVSGNASFVIASVICINLILLFDGFNKLFRVGMFEFSFKSWSSRIAISSIVFVSSFSLIFWSVRGMEVALIFCILANLIYVVDQIVNLELEQSRGEVRKILKLIILIFLGVLTRMDFAIFPITLAIVFLVFHRLRMSLQYFILPTASALLVIAGVQKIYYGSYLPNTFYLKIFGIDMIEKLSRGVFSLQTILPALILFVVVLIRLIKVCSQKFVVFYSISPIFSAVAYNLVTGGDAWEWSLLTNRFLAPITPFMFLVLTSFIMKNPALMLLRRQIGFVITIVMLLSYGLRAGPPKLTLDARLITFAFMTFVLTTLIGKGLLSCKKIEANILGVCVLVTTVILAVALPASKMALGGLHIMDDRRVKQESLTLKKYLTEDAVIATVWAGAPAYYSEHKMIDILGKNDKYIASSRPRAESGFYPGHNKWSYGYSIKQLQPDVVYQLWIHTKEDIQALKSWGYIELCHSRLQQPVFVKATSQKVLKEEFYACNE